MCMTFELGKTDSDRKFDFFRLPFRKQECAYFMSYYGKKCVIADFWRWFFLFHHIVHTKKNIYI